MSDNNLRLVLLSCCAPCSAGAIRQLAQGAIENVSDFIVLFFNPNIFPESEYLKRMKEQIKYCEETGVKYAVLEYDHDAWRTAVQGFETEPERGARCSLCFEYRFRRAVKFAQENGFNAIGSVLGVSRHKSQPQVDMAAEKAVSDFSHPLSVLPTSPAKGGGNYTATQLNNEKVNAPDYSGDGKNITYLPIKWDENLRVQINRESDFYRQNYCGCEFSIRKL